MLLSAEACVEMIIFSSATQLSVGSFKLFPLCDHYFVLLQYSQLQFPKAALLPVKRHLSLVFTHFLVVFYLQNSELPSSQFPQKQEILCYIKNIR